MGTVRAQHSLWKKSTQTPENKQLLLFFNHLYTQNKNNFYKLKTLNKCFSFIDVILSLSLFPKLLRINSPNNNLQYVTKAQ